MYSSTLSNSKEQDPVTDLEIHKKKVFVKVYRNSNYEKALIRYFFFKIRSENSWLDKHGPYPSDFPAS